MPSFFRNLSKILLLFFLSSSLFSGEWAKERLESLTLREKIAQLYMLAVWTDGPHSNVDQIEKIIQKYHLGSVLFMHGTIESQTKAYHRLQKMSPLPLLVGQDNEWGLELRLKGSLRFPRNLMLGALSDSNLIYELGKEIANQCKGVGVHINFAPVVDVNVNPLNPVINDRSFGEDPKLVSDFGLLMMKGLQDHGIMACAKHFPGHGDTHLDSHFSLPVIEKSKEALHAVEWKPFKNLINHELQSIMTAHLLFPQIEKTIPSSLSSEMIQGVLKENFGFNGLVITDSFQMKAISDQYGVGDSDLLALIAGNDLIIRFNHFETALDQIEEAVANSKISEKEIDEKVLKILDTKEQFNLHHFREIDPTIELFSASAKSLKKRLFREAITLVENKGVLPLSSTKRVAFVQIGRDVIMKQALEIVNEPYEAQCPKGPPPLYSALEKKLPIDFFFLPKKARSKDLKRLQKQLASYQKVVIGIYEMNKFSRLNFGLLDSTFNFLENLKADHKQIYLSLFGSPYSLKYFGNEEVILMCYENDEEAQLGAAEILLGERKATGRLPVTASEQYPRGHAAIQKTKAF